jgi:hypothetical protein
MATSHRARSTIGAGRASRRRIVRSGSTCTAVTSTRLARVADSRLLVRITASTLAWASMAVTWRWSCQASPARSRRSIRLPSGDTSQLSARPGW